MLKITLVKSVIGATPKNRRTVAALGLKKTGRVAFHEDSPSLQGMIRNVAHLIKVEEAEDAPKPKKAAAKPKAETKPAEEKKAEPKKAPAKKTTAKTTTAKSTTAKKPAAKKPAAKKTTAKKKADKES